MLYRLVHILWLHACEVREQELSETIEDSYLDWSGGYRGICFTQNLANYILL